MASIEIMTSRYGTINGAPNEAALRAVQGSYRRRTRGIAADKWDKFNVDMLLQLM